MADPQAPTAGDAAGLHRPLRWDVQRHWPALQALLPGLDIEVLASVDSTNDRLLARAQRRGDDPPAWGRRSDDEHPRLLVAERQTGGRGRRGRPWHSEPGASLTFSIGLTLAPADWSGLSLAVGLSLATSLHPDIGLKWPNDLWWQERKLAGILMVFPNMNLSIEGYTDATGSADLNMRLSTERARAVYEFLLAQGVANTRMKYQGFGPENPVAPNDSEANRARNRRVEVVLTQAPRRP